ncbi:MAG: SLBB domain-containing protein [Candidatus Omnitrophota bacterium]
MFRTSRCFNLLLSFVLLAAFIYPPEAFSREASGKAGMRSWVDESLGKSAMPYKKARCPSCGMEFYYMPGKDNPHSVWVTYETKKDEQGGDIEDLSAETEKKGLLNKDEAGDAKDNDIFDVFRIKGGKVKDAVMGAQGNRANNMLSGKEKPDYEIRQKLICPYDGYAFFSEGDLFEDAKIKQKTLFPEEPSQIEASFNKSISLNVSRDLKQFGYDLFKTEERVEGKEDKMSGKSDEEESLRALTTFSMLKSTLGSSGDRSPFSVQLGADTVVIPVSPDYIIGPGDTLIVNIWGSVQESFPVEVDREGKIMLPKAGPLYVWGFKFGDAENKIREKLNEYYTNFNVDISMGKLREVQVFIMGEVKKPGAYRISSQLNIFQALYAGGGPTKLGSIRKIKIISPDGKSREVDLYSFLLKGEGLDGSKIQSGDTIFVPPVGDVVAISGNVKRPGIYETKSEMPLRELLSFCGGITPSGNLQRIQVERIKDSERRVVVDMELDPAGKENSFDSVNLRNGDLVVVAPIVRLKHNFVTVLGNVENPGDYGLVPDMSVSDLVSRAKGFLPGTYTYRAEIARVTKDRTRQIIPVNLEAMTLGDRGEDALLKEWDILLIYSNAEVEAPSFVEVDGAVNRPGKYEFTPGMKVSDLIFKAGGVNSKDLIRGAELFHIMPGEQPVVRSIGIKRIAGPNISIDKDIILQSGDMLFVQSEPKLTERKIVAVKGEVRFPGNYPAVEGETLSSLIARAGGFTKEAFLDGAIFSRKSIKEVQEKMRQKFLEREQRIMLEEQQAVLLKAGSTADPAALTQSLRTKKEILDFVESVDIEGRMVIRLMPIDQLKSTKYDIPLEDGDVITIPSPPSAITVIGSVNNPASVPFDQNKGINYYIQKTGGLTKHADKNGIYVIRANGEAISKFMMTKYVNRGDTIVIPQEFKYWTPPGMLLKDTVEILSRIAIGVGIIAALD